ncbi:MAG: four helix bundle protein [Chitinophagaceae bacterium]|nr:MAG: four helix bundle protein [Chitinophagaceae bacterium]
MGTFTQIEEIDAWRLARELCREVQLICKETDLAKDFKLKDQIRRSSSSIMDNIAEGFGRGGNREFIHFLEISLGSCKETQSQLYRVRDSDYIDQPRFERVYRLSKRTSGAITGLIYYLQGSTFRGPRF